MVPVRLFLILFLTCASVTAQDFNYLSYAHESAMSMLFSFEVSANLYGSLMTDEAEKLSRALTDRVVDRLETISSIEEGFRMQGCVLQASTMALSVIWDVHDHIGRVHNGSVDFHQSVIRELMDVNILTTDFDTFYNEFRIHLYEAYNYLNYVLLTNVINSLQDLINVGDFLIPMLENCLGGVQK